MNYRTDLEKMKKDIIRNIEAWAVNTIHLNTEVFYRAASDEQYSPDYITGVKGMMAEVSSDGEYGDYSVFLQESGAETLVEILENIQ